MRDAREVSPEKGRERSGLQYSLEELIEAVRAHEAECLLDTREVCRQTSLHRNTIWKLECAGKFPRRRIIAGGKVVWLASEIRAWVQSRPTSEEVRHTLSATAPPRPPVSEPLRADSRLRRRPRRAHVRPD
jgi:predicted DNA-binding transcriptional regulator AlpA